MAKKKTLQENTVVAVNYQEFSRIANNYYNSIGQPVDIQRIKSDYNLTSFFQTNAAKVKDRKKVAVVCICLNPQYWQYAYEMVHGVRNFFLPGHDTDILLWSDLPNKDEIPKWQEGLNKTMAIYLNNRPPEQHAVIAKEVNALYNNLLNSRDTLDVTVFPTEPIEWPFPTLLRYNLFLQQEEKLKEYDYIFYCDVDMRFEGIVGDEILGDGITVAPHPGYYTRKEYWPPYEPNPESASYIKRPGKVVQIDGKPRFMPFYCAGGFQGGTSQVFIEAMKKTKDLIDKDMTNNYIPIWNDETAWNKYVFDVQTKEEIDKTIFLDPSYIYPDSLVQEYYVKLWGRDFPRKLITITKKFSLVPMDVQSMNNLIGI